MGFVPDRIAAVSEGRVSLAESLATSTSTLIDRGVLLGVRDNLEFVVQRNPTLASIELVRKRDGDTVVFGAEIDQSIQPTMTVDVYRGQYEWGVLRFHFVEQVGASLVERWRKSEFGLMLFVSLLSFPLFYVYLAKMLKELNPSSAVPGRVRNALDTIAEALIVLDKRGNIVLANAAFATLNGKSADALMGVQADKLGWVYDQEGVTGLPWKSVLESGETVHNAMVGFTDSTGSIRKFMVNCSPVTGNTDRVGGVLISMDDITLLEEKEQLLRHSMEAAEEANVAKSAFLSNMSHEIRTPMTAILGFTEVLSRGIDLSVDDRKRHLGTISKSGQHLLELINDVLDLSKVESGAMDVESIPTTMGPLANEVVKVLKVKADEKSVYLDLNITSSLPEHIFSDPSRLRQIMTNLVGNAIKFTERGGVKLEISHDVRGEEISIAVVDTGIGMNEAQQATIFDAFTQADSSITRRFGGTGLGLSISRKLAEALGGRVEVSSVPGEGSTFVVSVPTGDVTGIRLETPQEVLESLDMFDDDNNQHWEFPAAQILVVDDAPENRELLQVLLTDLGLSVSVAENGKVGLEMALAFDYAVVLMDIQMPVMDGYDAVAEMRKEGIKQPIVALTANAMKGYEEKILSAGFSHYQTKPIDIPKLTQLLAKLLGGKPIEKPAVVEPLIGSDSQSQHSVATAEHSTESSTESSTGHSAETRDTLIYSSLTAGNAQFGVIVEKFLDKLTTELDAMQRLHAEARWSELKDKAHWLKGSGGTVGFTCLYEPAKALEEAVDAGNERMSADRMNEIKQIASRLSPGEAARLDSDKTTNVVELDSLSDAANGTSSVFSALVDQNPAFLPLVERFIARLNEQIQSLDAAAEQKNWTTVGEIAHWLKGSGGSVGFSGFTEIAADLEGAAQGNSAEEVSLRIDVIKAYSDRVARGWAESEEIRRSA